MKYLYLFITIIISTSIFLFACDPMSKSENRTLSVSIEPQKYLLEQIVGDKYKINTAIPSGSNPETYDPSPSQMVNIGKSKIYFKIGNLGFENSWLKNISINSPNLKIVDCSEGISIIKDDHGHMNGDPHIWSSPKTVLNIARSMYNNVIQIDPQNKDYYLDRFQSVEKLILQTDSIIKQTLSEYPSTSFVIFHPSLSYFANEYGLNQYSIEVEGKNPTPKQLADLIKKAKKEDVKVVFIQKEYDVKNAESVAKEIGAKVIQINPLSYDWGDELVNIAKAIANKE